MAAMGILMAIIERNQSGKGQVVEVDMVRFFLAFSAFSHQQHR